MTEEQIKQNAEQYAINGNTRGSLSLEILFQNSRDAYIAGAHSRDEEIKELKEEIESLQEQYNTCFDGFKKRGTKLGELMKENVKLRNDNKDLEQALACAEDVVDIQRKELNQLRNPWHHVNDQMPKEREKIFFRENDGATYYGWFDERMQSFFTIAPDCTKWAVNGVTHWMPIPETPLNK